jgi:hypothetical protein
MKHHPHPSHPIGASHDPTAIREALEWNQTDIDDAKGALKEAGADLAATKAKRAELKAQRAALRSPCPA